MDLPFPQTAILFTQTVAGYIDVTGADSWRKILLSEDGNFAVYKDNRFRWIDLPGGKWSSDEALVIEKKPPVQIYTVSQDAHVPRSPTRNILVGSQAIAAYGDRSMGILVPLDVYNDPYQYAALVRFRARGTKPNLTRGLHPVIRRVFRQSRYSHRAG